MNIINKVTGNRADMKQQEIPIGTVFLADGFPPGPFLRAFETVVNLSNPESTWGDRSAGTNKVWTNYLPVKATITVENAD